MNNVIDFTALRRASAIVLAAGIGLALAASAAQSMPLKSPQDYFRTPAFGSHASTGPEFRQPVFGRAIGHRTSHPAAATTSTAAVERPHVPVLGRERFALRGTNSALPLVVASDGAVNPNTGAPTTR